MFLKEVSNYYLFLRICELASKCSVVKNDRGFDITIDNQENEALVNDMKKWVLHRRVRQTVLIHMIRSRLIGYINFNGNV